MPKYYGCPCEGCGKPLTLQDDIVVCPDCGAPYHRVCYEKLGLGYSGLAMFAGVAEMVARAMVGFWFVPLWGYFAACIANPVAWFFACFFLIPAYFAVRNRLMKENAYGVGD